MTLTHEYSSTRRTTSTFRYGEVGEDGRKETFFAHSVEAEAVAGSAAADETGAGVAIAAGLEVAAESTLAGAFSSGDDEAALRGGLLKPEI